MKAVRKQRLMLLVFVLLGVGMAIALALTALQENINLYFSPSQMAQGEAPIDKRIRGGGVVVVGSVQRDSQSLLVTFDITDGQGVVTVHYDGILPDLFREGQGIVALGSLDQDRVFHATEVLAKHDENYMPPEVQDAIDKAHPSSHGAYPGSASSGNRENGA